MCSSDLDGRAVPQTYRGEVTSTEEVPSAYSKELITDLARNKMGFDGYVNSDSGITTVQIYGVENLTEPERYAKVRAAAEKNTRARMALLQIAQQENLLPTDEEIDKQLAERAEKTKKTVEEIKAGTDVAALRRNEGIRDRKSVV